MAVENWIDSIADLWGAVDDGKGKHVKSYSVFKRGEFPSAISEFPCAITYVTRVPTVQYSAGGPAVVIWQGVTEFHLVPNIDKTHIPYVIRFYDRIIRAAASSITLGGLVTHFLLSNEEPLQPGSLVYGNEAPHYGVVVNWVVKENPTIVAGA